MKKIMIFLISAIVIVYAAIAAIYLLDLGEKADDYMTLEYRLVDENGLSVANAKGDPIVVKQSVGLYYNKTTKQNETKSKTTKLKDSDLFAHKGYTLEYWNIGGVMYKAGSYLKAGLTKPDSGPMEATPTWVEKEYTIAFKSNGGSAVQSTKLAYKSQFGSVVGVESVRKGYAFKGWYTTATSQAGEPVTASTVFGEDFLNLISKNTLTLHARWDEKKVNITFDTNGGTGGNGQQQVLPGVATVINGGVPTIEDKMTPLQTSYKFKSWNKNKDGTGTSYSNNGSYTFTENVTLYAQWEARVYTVYFDANGGNKGTMKTSKNFTSGVQQLLEGGEPSPTISGKSFKGWSTIKTGIGPQQYEPYQNNDNMNFFGENETITLYAVWG